MTPPSLQGGHADEAIQHFPRGFWIASLTLAMTAPGSNPLWFIEDNNNA